MASDPLNQFVRDALAKSQLLGQRAAEWHAHNQRQIDAVVQSLSNPVVRAAAWVQQHEAQIRAVLDQISAFNRLADQIEQQWADAGLGLPGQSARDGRAPLSLGLCRTRRRR
jgi:hypothetical protein